MEIVLCAKLQRVQGGRAIFQINALPNEESTLAMQIMLLNKRSSKVRRKQLSYGNCVLRQLRLLWLWDCWDSRLFA